MRDIFSDIWQIISSLSLIDYILYFAVVALIILVVSLIYYMFDDKEEEIFIQKEDNMNDELDLQNIINVIDEKPKPLVDMTSYEEEQESKAIISYDELIKENKPKINYAKEEMVDDIIPVKKISLDTNIIGSEPKIEVNVNKAKMFSYEKEEAFLKALKELNEILN